MATTRPAKELKAWTLTDWSYVLSDWDDLTEDGYVDCLGNRLEKRSIDELAEALSDKGYDTQNDVDQLWLDLAMVSKLLGSVEDGHFNVKAPIVFGGSE